MIVDKTIFGKIFWRFANIWDKRPKSFSAHFIPFTIKTVNRTFRMFPARFPDRSVNSQKVPAHGNLTKWNASLSHAWNGMLTNTVTTRNLGTNTVNNQHSCRTMLYIWTRVWMLHTLNNGWTMLFQCFSCKKLKEEEKAIKLRQNLAKKLKDFFWGF